VKGRVFVVEGIRVAVLLSAIMLEAPLAPAEASDLADSLADYTVVTWTGADGLFSGNIFAITQDREGYLWLGNDEGIVRFDGVRFVPWSALSRTPLPQRRVLSLLSADDGCLWVAFGGAGGISQICNRDIRTYTERDGLPRDFVRVLRQDRQGTVWGISPSGVYRFDGKSWHQLGADNGVPEGSIWNAYEDAAGNFWIVTTIGIFRRDAGTDRFRAVDSTNIAIRDLTEDSAGRILTTDPVVGFRTLGERSSVASGSAQGVKHGYGARLICDRRGNLWVGTQGQGLWRVPRENIIDRGAIQAITVRSGLASDQVRSMLEDRDGNIWIGTTGGLHRFSPRIVRTVTDLGLVRSVVVADDGATLVGTANGLFRLSQTRRTYEPLITASIFALHKDANSTLWIGTDLGLYRFAKRRIEPVPLPNPPLRQIVAITSDSKGQLWLCDRERGVFSWNHRELRAFWPRQEVSRRTAYGVFAGRSDRVWIALSGGLLGLIDAEHELQLFGPAGDGSLRVVLEGRDKTVWLGGEDGLSRFDNERFVTASRLNGLPGSAVSALVEDAEGDIWAGVGSGIIRFDPSEFDQLAAHPSHQIRYEMYDKSDGVAGEPSWFAAPSSHRGGDGRLWFVTGGGLTVLDPATTNRSSVEPRAQIAGAIADDEILEPFQRTVLRPLTQRLEIEYTAVSFVSPMKVRFRYRLDGFDKDWIDAGTRRQAFYTNLAPRSYRFRVVAATSEHAKNESEAQWEFSIAPAFHQTTWFYASAAAMVVPVLWLGWRLRLRQVKRRFSLVLSERARMSRELHDTLLQSLVGVGLQIEGLSHRVDASSPQLKDHLLRMRTQVDDYIREARQSILGLHPPTSVPRDLVDALRDAGERITTGSSARFDFQVAGAPRRCHPSIEDELLQIGREALHNAVHHSQASHIRLQLQYSRRSLRLRVSDNGVGFDGQPVAGHCGLANMHERAKQIGGRLEIVTHAGNGTQIEVVAPIS
jgi:signal transduction histidine kinase/ligand-binding sensor domain-containing protein